MGIPDHLLRNLYADQEAINSQNWTWNNELVENWERIIVTIFLKEYIKAVYCYPAYLTSMQSYAKCQAG